MNEITKRAQMIWNEWKYFSSFEKVVIISNVLSAVSKVHLKTCNILVRV